MREQEHTVRMFVNGQAMSGGSLHPALADATFLGAVKTAPHYRFFSVRDEFPGLWPVAEGGVQISGEVYEVSYEQLRVRLLPHEPVELELTVIELSDGVGSLSMRMRDRSLELPDVLDISDHGDWRVYLESL